MNTFSFVGYLKPSKNSEDRKSFEVKPYDSGWMSERLRFMVVADNNTHFVEINAGKWKDDSKNVIYGYTKGGVNKNGEAVQIPWSQRNSESVIDNMAGWKVFTVDLDTYQHRKEVEDSGDAEAIAKSHSKRKHFLAGTEFCEYVNKVVNNEKVKDVKFRVNGNVTYTYSEKNDRYYSTFEVNKIYRVDDSVESSSEVNIDFYFTEHAVDSDDYDETGKAIVNGWTPFYDSFTKKNWYCPITLAMRLGTDDKGKKQLKGWKKIFEKFEDDEIRRILLSCEQINGAQKVDITYDDLDEDTKDNIDFGIISLEDVIKDLGDQMYGDKIQEIRINKLGRGFTKGSETTMYTVDDMNKKPIREIAAKVKTDDDDDVDLFSSDDDLDDL